MKSVGDLLQEITVNPTVMGITIVLLHGLAIAAVLFQQRRGPSTTVAWLLTLVFLPVVGLVLFWLLGTTRLDQVARGSAVASARVRQVLAKHSVHRSLTPQRGSHADPRTEMLLKLGEHLTSTPASTGNHVELLMNGAATYRSMLQAISGAQHHVHVLFYIIQPDATGQSLRRLLTQKARAGVEVRVLCDAIGSMALPMDFWRPLIEAGGKAAFFRPVLSRLAYRLRQRDRIDFRNHRKVVVVDGSVGFTGGINVGREYLGLDPNIGHWRDTHLRINGPAALGLQQTFAEDWLYATDELLESPDYFPGEGFPADGQAVVQVIDSGPDRNWSPIVHLFCQAIALSQKRVWITNPYFVPTVVLKTVLLTAALRGVDVRLLLPKKADHMLVSVASRSYYPELLEAGIQIYEYRRGFVHSKTMVIDDWLASVGSANMDIRSFHLNFELNAFVYGAETAQALAKQFLHDLQQAERVDPEEYFDLGLTRQLAHSVGRLLSPLL